MLQWTPLDTLGWSTGLNISQKHSQTSFPGWLPSIIKHSFIEPDTEKHMQGLSTSINWMANHPAAEALEKHCKFNVEKVNDQSWFLYPHNWFRFSNDMFSQILLRCEADCLTLFWILRGKGLGELNAITPKPKETTKTTVTQFHLKILCSIKKTMFDNVFDWYSTLWIILEPQLEHKPKKSVFTFYTVLSIILVLL